MNTIITIGREFGSGGRELGRRLAEELHAAYYDQEIVKEIAKRTSTTEDYVRSVEEKKPLPPITIGSTFMFYQADIPDPNRSIFVEQSNIIKEAAEKSDCVIVGRCADYILADKHPFRIFVYADMPSRIARCRERGKMDKDISDAEMEKKIRRIDKARAQYYEYWTDQKWGRKASYDLCINTSGRDIKELIPAVVAFIPKK